MGSQVQVWFQNRRQRDRNLMRAQEEAAANKTAAGPTEASDSDATTPVAVTTPLMVSASSSVTMDSPPNSPPPSPHDEQVLEGLAGLAPLAPQPHNKLSQLIPAAPAVVSASEAMDADSLPAAASAATLPLSCVAPSASSIASASATPMVPPAFGGDPSFSDATGPSHAALADKLPSIAAYLRHMETHQQAFLERSGSASKSEVKPTVADLPIPTHAVKPLALATQRSSSTAAVAQAPPVAPVAPVAPVPHPAVAPALAPNTAAAAASSTDAASLAMLYAALYSHFAQQASGPVPLGSSAMPPPPFGAPTFGAPHLGAPPLGASSSFWPASAPPSLGVPPFSMPGMHGPASMTAAWAYASPPNPPSVPPPANAATLLSSLSGLSSLSFAPSSSLAASVAPAAAPPAPAMLPPAPPMHIPRASMPSMYTGIGMGAFPPATASTLHNDLLGNRAVCTQAAPPAVKQSVKQCNSHVTNTSELLECMRADDEVLLKEILMKNNFAQGGLGCGPNANGITSSSPCGSGLPTSAPSCHADDQLGLPRLGSQPSLAVQTGHAALQQMAALGVKRGREDSRIPFVPPFVNTSLAPPADLQQPASGPELNAFRANDAAPFKMAKSKAPTVPLLPGADEEDDMFSLFAKHLTELDSHDL